MTLEIRLSGSGGQGLILIGRILAEALGIFKGQNVVQSSSYGGQVRGGYSRSDVLISPANEEIDFPEVMNADILMAMTQEAANEYSEKVKPGGFIILDATFVKKPPKTSVRIISYPFTLETKERLGTELPANMVILAVIDHVGKLGGKDALVKAIKKRSPRGKVEINLQALNLGYELADTGVLQGERKY